MKMLWKPIKQPDDVDGLAMLDRKLYVLRRRSDAHIYQYVFDDSLREYVRNDFIPIPGLSQGTKKDLTECDAEMCLFVSNADGKCIYRVDPKTKKVTQFLDLALTPRGLSITPEGHLLVACTPNKLMEYNVATGELVTQVQLLSDTQYPKHAIKREDGQYLVCHAMKNSLHRVCLINAQGSYRHCYGGMKGSDDLQLLVPSYMALGEKDFVVVADNDNNRIVLLNPMLEFKRNLLEDFREPHRLYFDQQSNHLYVGECTDNGTIKVFQLPKPIPDEVDSPLVDFDSRSRKPRGEVDGLATLDNKLYVLRARNDDQIGVFDSNDKNEFTLPQRVIKVPGLTEDSDKDMTECVSENCLFVADGERKCIHKVEPKAHDRVGKFVDVPLSPRGLSMTPEGTLLVACDPDKLIEYNVKTAEVVCEVQLHSDMHHPKHAIKRADGQYVVCHSLGDNLHRVCIIYKDAYYRHCHGGNRGSGDTRLKEPCHLALLKDNNVVVADNGNNRLVLLGSALQFRRHLVENIAKPHRLLSDLATERLYAGDSTEAGAVRIFSISPVTPAT